MNCRGRGRQDIRRGEGGLVGRSAVDKRLYGCLPGRRQTRTKERAPSAVTDSDTTHRSGTHAVRGYGADMAAFGAAARGVRLRARARALSRARQVTRREGELVYRLYVADY